MTLEIILILIGLATVLFLACLYSTILYDKNDGLLDFLLLEIIRLEEANGNVMVEDRVTGDTWFCSREIYEDNKNIYKLIENITMSDIKVESDD